jgi:hypothetical protein
VWENNAQQSPLLLPTTVVLLGVNYDVTITLPAGYLGGGDTVIVTTAVEDNDGNATTYACSFEMGASEDLTPPVVTWESPECGSVGVAPDAPAVFTLTDPESGVDITTIQVFVKIGAAAEIQVLQNGVTWLLDYYGSVVAIADGFRVMVNRPAATPLWPSGEDIRIRVTACNV